MIYRLEAIGADGEAVDLAVTEPVERCASSMCLLLLADREVIPQVSKPVGALPEVVESSWGAAFTVTGRASCRIDAGWSGRNSPA